MQLVKDPPIITMYGTYFSKYDGHTCEWYDDMDTLQLWHSKEAAEARLKEMENEIPKCERWDMNIVTYKVKW